MRHRHTPAVPLLIVAAACLVGALLLTWLGVRWFVLEDDDGMRAGLVPGVLALAAAAVAWASGLGAVVVAVLAHREPR